MLLAVLAAAAGASSPSVRYRIVPYDQGLQRTTFPIRGSINSQGTIAGEYFPASGPSTGFVWNQATGIRLLPSLRPQEPSSTPTAINDSGLIVGVSSDSNGTQAVLWNSQLQVSSLGRVATGTNFWFASDINNSNVIVGQAYVGATRTAVRYDIGGQLSALPIPTGYQESWALDISDSVRILGKALREVRTGFFLPQAVVWENNSYRLLSHAGSNLQSSSAGSQNARGDILGSGGVPRGAGGTTAGIIWLADQQQPIVLHPDTIFQNSPLAASRQYNIRTTGVGSITEDRRVFGGVSVRFGFTERSLGFVRMPDGEITILNDLLLPEWAAWNVSGAREIQPNGLLLATGIDPTGAGRGFFMIPVPEPATGIIVSSLVALVMAYSACSRRDRLRSGLHAK